MAADAVPGRGHVADEDRQAAWQNLLLVFAQQFLHRHQSHVFVAVEENGHEQGFGAFARQVDERGPRQYLVQRGGGRLQETPRQFVEYIELR